MVTDPAGKYAKGKYLFTQCESQAQKESGCLGKLADPERVSQSPRIIFLTLVRVDRMTLKLSKAPGI